MCFTEKQTQPGPQMIDSYYWIFLLLTLLISNTKESRSTYMWNASTLQEEKHLQRGEVFSKINLVTAEVLLPLHRIPLQLWKTNTESWERLK